MEGTDPVVRPTWLGRVEIVEPGASMSSPGPGGGGVISRTRHAWLPGPELEARLPRGFRLEVDGLAGPDGARRFMPAATFRDVFVVEGIARRAWPCSRVGCMVSTPSACPATTPCG